MKPSLLYSAFLLGASKPFLKESPNPAVETAAFVVSSFGAVTPFIWGNAGSYWIIASMAVQLSTSLAVSCLNLGDHSFGMAFFEKYEQIGFIWGLPAILTLLAITHNPIISTIYLVLQILFATSALYAATSNVSDLDRRGRLIMGLNGVMTVLSIMTFPAFAIFSTSVIQIILGIYHGATMIMAGLEHIPIMEYLLLI